ncbi:hypothetical protein NG01_04480 [Corynebacterium diphtheriae]|uniref:AsnC family protein n=1 Tax=Corynebacterium diphtheriae TaxID=1717 RepID=UPI0005EB03F7|nr:AsnC family protein [Corynebacterium diphtheriae]KJJ60037.1 hypothetical protein NG01_04480 [Corynebacterium diphtheriae]
MHDTRLEPLTTVPMSVREIAQLFGVTPNAIRGRIRRLELIPIFEDTSGARPVFFYAPRDIERLRVFDQPRLFLDEYEQSEIKFFMRWYRGDRHAAITRFVDATGYDRDRVMSVIAA